MNEFDDKLKKGLCEEQKKLFEEYKEQQTIVESHLKQILYELGFVDGIKIATHTGDDIIKTYPIFKNTHR